MSAFMRGDVNRARQKLAVYKDASTGLRTCASDVWRRGITLVIRDNITVVVSKKSVQELLRRTAGCDASAEDGSWLSIPRVQETVVCVSSGGRKVVLVQDGFLRAFDMSTVLWPAGFFLTLWVQDNCARLAGQTVLELGAGIGAPSIVASHCGASKVVATDKEDYALLNVKMNAELNKASVSPRLLDWHNDADVEAIAALGPFDFVIGAGLATPRWADRFWTLLSKMLRPSTGVAVIVQGNGDLEVANGTGGNGSFVVDKVVPGDNYGLSTRWGTPSEFELHALRYEGVGRDEL
eukprot:TRINITY_DN40145_c0_g1_i1.p1 TRINITY_DN40145_c0_g1~~TRINITY_DN40145_c0_g1_i1.p1  ORF type:complete len:345 (+),score=46.88 TRINITY_DN40145_c0_g1_i1:154-1035(+)